MRFTYVWDQFLEIVESSLMSIFFSSKRICHFFQENNFYFLSTHYLSPSNFIKQWVTPVPSYTPGLIILFIWPHSSVHFYSKKLKICFNRSSAQHKAHIWKQKRGLNSPWVFGYKVASSVIKGIYFWSIITFFLWMCKTVESMSGFVLWLTADKFFS